MFILKISPVDLAENLITDMTGINDLLYFIEVLARKFVERNCIEITHEQIGIDIRSYGKIWITSDNDYIVTRNLSEYYSGFSYVDKNWKINFGDYMFYSNGDKRIEGHIDNYLSYVEEDETLTDETKS